VPRSERTALRVDVDLPAGFHIRKSHEADHQSISTTTSPSSTSTPFSTSTQRSYTQSETFSSPQQRTDSETEVETEYFDSEDETSDSSDGTDSVDHIVRVVESRLLFVLCNDFDLAARLIPQVHSLVEFQLGRTATGIATRSPQTDGNEQSQKSTYKYSAATGPGQGQKAKSHPQKRGVNPDDPEDPDEMDGRGRNRRPKRLKPASGEAMPTFACHFFKKDPNKYNPWTDMKYRTCVRPSVPYDDVRRIK
jgi:hypothetical protein